MIRINLLPHREQARIARRQHFYVLLGATAVAGLLIWWIVHSFNTHQIENQESKNEFLKREIANLDKEIAEIKRLKEQMQSLLSRKQVIESLQSNRAETVHIFNELAKQLPEGVYLKTIKQTGLKIQLIGYAQSNARVSQLMRNLDASPVLEKPELVEIKAAEVNKRNVNEFNLYVSIERAVKEVPANPGATTPSKEKKS